MSRTSVFRTVRAVSACAALALVAACQGPPAGNQAARDPRAAAIERGKFLVTIGGCNDCHTPLTVGPNGPQPDMTRMLSGHPETVLAAEPPPTSGPWVVSATATLTGWAGPWGVSYASNLTPDDETGIGAWDETLFLTTIRKGKYNGGGRPILPPMPWQALSTLPDEDLKAIFAYLKSVPAVKNEVPRAVIAASPAAPGEKPAEKS